MIRLTLIAGTYQPRCCGVAHYTQRLRQALPAEVVQSRVLTTHAAALESAKTVQGAVADWSLSQLIPLVRAILATPTDILHIQHAAGTYQFERSLFLLPPLLRTLGYRSPIVVTLHEYGWWEWTPGWLPTPLLERIKEGGQRRGWWDREDGFLITGSQATIVTNAEAAGVLRDRLPHHPYHLIPIAANVTVSPAANSDHPVDHPREALRAQFQWPASAQVITFFGFLHPVKGLETLLEAFQHLQQRHPQARLLIIGGAHSLALGDEADWYWNQLHGLVDHRGLSNFVAFTGYLKNPEISAHLLGSDVGVLPFNHGVTLKSGSLLTLLAHGLPVVATTANPPDPELTPALLEQVPPKQPSRLAAGLAALLTNSARRDSLRHAGLAFSQRFSWEAIAAQHLAVYQSLSKGSTADVLMH